MEQRLSALEQRVTEQERHTAVIMERLGTIINRLDTFITSGSDRCATHAERLIGMESRVSKVESAAMWLALLVGGAVIGAVLKSILR